MNVLILNWRDISHPWAGGAERHLHELGKQLVKKGHNVSMLVGGYKGCLKSEMMEGIEIIRVGNTYTIFLIAPFFYVFIMSKRFDVVIDTSHGIPSFSKFFTRKPVILIVHHDHKKLWETEFGGLLAKLGVFVERKLVPFVYKNSQVVTLSDTEKKHLKSSGFKYVSCFPPGVGKKFKPGRRKFKAPIILYLGRLRRYKRVEFLLELFPGIKKKVPGVKLIISGNGQDRRRLEYLARKKGLDKEIVFKGFVSEDEKVELYQRSWVLALPSLMEGWGLVSMESAACGTPTVGFKVPGVKDAVKDGQSGILVSSKKQFSDAIIQILKDRKLRRKLSSGAVDWSKNFGWDGCAERFIKLLEQTRER